MFFAGGYFFAGWVPLASDGPLRDFAFKHSEDLREEIGWDDLVKNVASVRDSLPADQQDSVGILVGNYGEQGAIEMLRTGIPSAAAHQHDQLGVAARLSDTAAFNRDRGWLFAGMDREKLHRVPLCRPYGQLTRRQERRERVSH